MRRAILATLISVTASRAAGADFDELLRRAAEARAAGDSEGTITLLREAHQLRPLPELLNNIGRTLEELGRYDEAADAYRRVVADPSSKPALVELDRQRLDALGAKLDRAWLRVGSSDALGFLDGDPIEVGKEIEVPLGPHLLEISQGESGVLFFFTALPSRRMDVARSPRERLEVEALLDLSNVPIRRFFLNDRPIRSTSSIALPAGTYRIRYETERGTQSKQIRIGEGRTLMLASVLDLSPRADPAPAITAVEIERPVAGPVIFGVAGVIAGGVGGLLIGLAEIDRDRVRDADRDAEGVTVGITQVEATRLQSRGNARATAGVVALSTAGALGIGAVLWWLFGGSELSF